jgi:ATP-binding cassette subfamily B protein
MTLKRVWRLLRGYRKHYILAAGCAFLAVLFWLQQPVIFRIVADNVLGGKPVNEGAVYTWLIEAAGGVSALKNALWICGAALLAAVAVYGFMIFCRERLSALASESMAKRLKDELYDHIQRMPYNYHVNARAGDLIQRCTSDVETVRKFLSSQVTAIARIAITIVISLIVLFSTNAALSLVGLAGLPFIFFASLIFHSAIKKNFKTADEIEGALSTVIQESLSGVRVVRAFGRQRHETEKFDKKNEELTKLRLKLNHMLSVYWAFSDIICFGQIGAVLITGAYLAAKGSLSIGELVMFNAYEAGMVFPLRQLGRVLSDMGMMQIALERLYDVLDSPEEEFPAEDESGVPLTGDIAVKDLMFAYGDGQTALNGVSFAVKAGQTAAILGTTGSGKSSLMHLLLRLYDYGGGSVTIGGKELNTISKKWLRERIGLVSQEPFLFSKSIRDNLLMARSRAADEEIAAACETACAHGFINGFEKGYDTMVGERGVTLSGGQKQRAVIARTLLRDSDILIFDDSLSAVDSETDAKIRAALAERRKGVTTFIVSQRITTIMEADLILVFEEGRLTETGSHDELAAGGGLYARIWNIQNMMEEEFDRV